MGTRELVEIIHTHVAAAEKEIRWALSEMRLDDDRGWSSETLQMIWLSGDAERLRDLALEMEGRRDKLIRRGEDVPAENMPQV